jgi:hypothetical protein
MKKFYLNSHQHVSKIVFLFWVVLNLFVFGNTVFAQTTTVTITTTGSSTWTVPCGVTSITVEAWGAGGAGGASITNSEGGSGGGGGGYSSYIATVTPSTIINYTIGTGGMGGASNGGNGGATTILALTANGGSGGNQNMGTFGSGGTAAGGTTNTSGGNGITGTASAGEAGGNSPNGGTGGVVMVLEASGNNGNAPGGGGGGGFLLSGVGPSNGGNGGDGQIKITYNNPIPNAPSAVTPASGVSICSGKSTNLNATSAGNTINWYTLAVGGSIVGTSASGTPFSVSPITSTTYFAEAQTSSGCVSSSRTATALITVNPLPASPTLVTPNSTMSLCNGTSINSNATSTGNTIYWYTVVSGGANIGNSPSGNPFLVTPAFNTTTTYYAEAHSPAGCVNTPRVATSAITTSAPPSITVQPVSPTAMCAGSGIRTITVTSTASTWQWRRNGIDLTNTAPYSGVTTPTLTITNPAVTDSGTFSVMLNGSSCSLVSSNVTLTVNSLPTSPISVTPSSTIVACTVAGTTPLNATSVGNTIDWYTVSTGGTSIGSSASGVDFLASAPTATVYYAEARNAATGCVSSSRTATASVTSNVLPVITVQPVAPAATCSGTGTIIISVTANGVSSYQWRRNGVNLTNVAPYSGVTTATLTITNPPFGDNGISFDVVLNSATCLVASTAVTLTLNAAPSPPTSVLPSSPVSLCSGVGSVNLNAISASNTIYWYTVASGGVSISNSASGANLLVSPAATTTYYAEARNVAGCNSATRIATATITVTATPVVLLEFTEGGNDKTYTITTCGHIANSENDLDVRSGNPAGNGAQTFGTATGQWQMSSNPGGPWVNAPGPTSTEPQYIFDPTYTTFENVPGVYYFRLIITNNGCSGTSDTLTLTVTGTATLTGGSIAANQSSCTGPFNPPAFTETTAVTGGAGAGTYSYIWQSSIDNTNFTTISGATAVTYDEPAISQTTYYRRWVVSGSNGGGCSAVSNTITVLVGTLSAPVIGTITQPTCALATGSVVLSGLPGGSWTINPGNISGSTVSTTIPGLAAGTYNFTVTQSSCTSPASANVVINVAPVVPVTPTASVTIQPTCTTPTGTIVVTAPAPAANVSYTVTGTAPVVAAVTHAAATFATLSPGTYSVTTTNTTSGCTSAIISLTVNAIPANPAAPTASVTIQPTCTTPTGTIVVTAPAPAANVTYTVTGTAPVVAAITQATTTFATLTPGTYSVKTTNTTTGCVSTVINLTVNAIPANPAAPTASVTIQPTCTTPTGTIVVTAPAPAANVTYTVTGTAPVVAAVTQATTTFATLTPGTYSVKTTNTTTGCVSTVINLTVNAIPANPAAPTASVTIQPTCTTPTGTIVVTAPAPAANVTYTVTGTAPVVAAITQATTTFATLTPGTYSVKTTNTTTGCVSTVISLTINAQPTTPTAPTIGTITQPTCALATGSVILNGLPASGTWTLNPGAISDTGTSTTLSGLSAGTYNYTVTNAAGCTSVASANVVINTQPVTPTAPTVGTITQPTCALATGSVILNGLPASGTWTLNPGAISGTGTSTTLSGLSAGTYNYTVTNTAGCTSVASTNVVINTQPTTPSIPTLSSGIVNCTDFTANWTASTNATGYRIDVATDATFTSILPAYSNILLGSGVLTENVTAIASGSTFYIRVRAENSCGTSANSATLVISTGTSSTAFSTTIEQPTCVLATGKITIVEAIVNLVDEYSFDDGVTYQSSNVKSALAPGTYKVKIRNTDGCVTLSTTVVLNPAITTTYTGSWSNGVPTILTKAIFASNFTLTGNLTACSCQVNTAVSVTVNPGIALVLENGLDVVGTGLITFENNSSLIQTNNTAINTGNITYKRKTTPIEKFDYTYWSSPVANQQLVNVSPTTLADKYYSFDPLINDWHLEAPTNTMTNGIGYIIRGPQAYLTPTIYEASFIGIPNNGNIINNTTGIGLTYLFGNPYPSAIDADLFLNLNNNVLEGTIYFWTHNTPITNNKYTADDYASYNIIGGTGTAAISTGINNSIPTGKIAAGQSFMTTSSGIGTVTFNNSLRILGMNTQFFRLIDSSKTKTTLKKNRIWLNLTNSEGAFKQTLIGYVTGATNGLDNRFDGETFDANQYVDFYSINLGKNLVIQGRALPFNRTDTVPLGYRTTVAGNFSIKIDQLDGLFTTHNIYIEDKNTGIIHDLKKEAYVFTTAIGTYNDRFVLKYTENPLPPKGNIKHPNYVIVTNQNNKIKIYSSEENIDKVIIYDITGKQIYKITNVNDDQLAIENLASSQQILVLKIVLKNKKIVTKKIFY